MIRRRVQTTPNNVEFKNDWRTGPVIVVDDKECSYENGKADRAVLVKLPDEYAAVAMFLAGKAAVLHYRNSMKRQIDWLDKTLAGE